MKFLIPLLATSAIATASSPTRRQGQTDVQIAQAALASITAGNTAVQNGLAGYTLGNGVNDPLAGNIFDLITTIQQQTTAVAAIGVLNQADSISLTDPTLALARGTNQTIDATIARKPDFITDCIATLTYQLLNETRTAARDFSSTILTKIDPQLTSVAQGLIGQIDAAFQRGIDAYADQATESCRCTASDPTTCPPESSTTTTTTTTTTSATADVTTTTTTTTSAGQQPGSTTTTTTTASSTKYPGWGNWETTSAPHPTYTTTTSAQPDKPHPTTTPGQPHPSSPVYSSWNEWETTTSAQPEKPHPSSPAYSSWASVPESHPSSPAYSSWASVPESHPSSPAYSSWASVPESHPTTPVTPPAQTTPYTTTYKPTATTSKMPIYTGAAAAVAGNLGAVAVVAAVAALL